MEPTISLKPFVHSHTSFTPTETTITQQIKHWPVGLFFYPPIAWVEPRKGAILCDGVRWSFAFHRAGISFAQRESPIDISLEFSKDGHAAITECTFLGYAKSRFADTPALAELFTDHDMLFEQAIAAQVLIPVPPLLNGDDQTYVLAAEL